MTSRGDYDSATTDQPGRWPSPGDDDAPAAGGVDCWAYDVGHPPVGLAAVADQILSAEERARAARFRHAADAAAYAASHVGLRLLLARYLHVEAGAIVIRPEPGGRPVIDNPGAAIHFNLSHSGDLALVAVSRDAPVGVDVEAILPVREARAIAHSQFHPEEHQALAGLADPAFFVTWTRKEAVAKALGLGLAFEFHRFSTGRADERPALTLPDADPSRWTLADLQLAAGYAGAVATPWPEATLRCRSAPWAWLLDGSG